MPNPIAILFRPSLDATESAKKYYCQQSLVMISTLGARRKLITTRNCQGQPTKPPLCMGRVDFLNTRIGFSFLKKDNLIVNCLARPPDILNYPKHWRSHRRLIILKNSPSVLRAGFYFVENEYPTTNFGKTPLQFLAEVCSKCNDDFVQSLWFSNPPHPSSLPHVPAGGVEILRT